MRDAEYDRFGPWILEITDTDPLPPLFVPHLSGDETPQLSIKIPRKIERRNAHPGMNLYDYVVNLYQDDVLILERFGDEVMTHKFLYENIESLCCREELLSGSLTLFMENRCFNLPFNTVSSDIIHRLVDLIRKGYIDTILNKTITNQSEYTDKNLSFFFTGLLAVERIHNPELKVIASQTETHLTSRKLSTFKKLFYKLVDKRLLESLHLSDGRELKIISRGKTFKYRGQAVYGKEIHYIPVKKITAVDWKENQKNPGVIDLSITTPGGIFPFSFMQNSSSLESYRRILQQVIY